MKGLIFLFDDIQYSANEMEFWSVDPHFKYLNKISKLFCTSILLGRFYLPDNYPCETIRKDQIELIDADPRINSISSSIFSLDLDLEDNILDEHLFPILFTDSKTYVYLEKVALQKSVFQYVKAASNKVLFFDFYLPRLQYQ